MGLWLAGWGNGAWPFAVATAAAVALLAAIWVRTRRRWLYEWLRLGVGYLVRRRSPSGDLLSWLCPGAQIVADECDGDPAGIIEHTRGPVALLELGDPTALLSETAALPPPHTLLAPGIRLHLVVSGVPAATGAGLPSASYRQLTERHPLAQQRAVLAVRAVRTDMSTEDDLHRTLASAVRRIRRRLAPTTGARLLGEPAALGVLADLVCGDEVREGWQGVRAGGLWQATFAVHDWPDLREPAIASLVPRLLSLPATMATVGLAVEEADVALTVRLAAPHAAGLAVAAHALSRLLSGYGASAERMDGEQVRGLAATLPTGVLHNGQSMSVESLAMLAPPVGGAGLVLGENRRGDPVVVRLFRPEPTRAMLVGGLRAAQLVTLRALALGAEVVVQSARPHAWEPFVRGVSAPGETVSVVPPGYAPFASGGSGNALRPQLVVVDAGPVPSDLPANGAPWRTTLVVRDELAAGDLDALARADLVVLQPLAAAEAELAAGALGLGAAQEWLTRIQGDMVGVVNRRTVRWALLTATQLEHQVVGTPTRG
jgi:type VII secretion protein EccE